MTAQDGSADEAAGAADRRQWVLKDAAAGVAAEVVAAPEDDVAGRVGRGTASSGLPRIEPAEPRLTAHHLARRHVGHR